MNDSDNLQTIICPIESDSPKTPSVIFFYHIDEKNIYKHDFRSLEQLLIGNTAASNYFTWKLKPNSAFIIYDMTNEGTQIMSTEVVDRANMLANAYGTFSVMPFVEIKLIDSNDDQTLDGVIRPRTYENYFKGLYCGRFRKRKIYSILKQFMALFKKIIILL